MSPYVRFAPLNDYLVYTSSHNDSGCPNGTQWLWTIMGDCAVTTRDQISAYVGLVSMVTWMMVTMPQIVKNFRNIDGMSGVSFLLIFQWTAGDATNLIGAILTNQLKPQIYLACYFVASDVVLLMEYLVFFIRKKKREKENVEAGSVASRAVLCLMGLVSVSPLLTGVLKPSNFNAQTRIEGAPTGHLSRFLLSKEKSNNLIFKSERQIPKLASTLKLSSHFWHNTKDVLGYTIGCVSSVFYLGSRSSQIYKNYKDKSTEGLAILTFILAVVGNITYGGQILIESLDGEFLLEHTPWLVGSLGVIGLDCTLLWQFHYYARLEKRRDEARQSLINHEHCTINSDPVPHQALDSKRDSEFSDSLY